ncbi:MAG: ABC transporter ATP-binding protein [Anaerolineales bacterium]|nr:ABC transporter ATP-binding protein [Anaerolineales bacterium]
MSVISVENLSFTYAGSAHPAIRQLNFNIDRGEIFGFLGPSGAGKSTTQKVLIGLLRDFKGEVSVFGQDLRNWKADFYERIGVSFEFPNHYLKLTALENLNYFARLYEVETRPPPELLALVGLEEDGHTRVSQFSKGMKVRLTVARSLLNNPDVLFMDEPTAGLDPVNARRIKELIKEEKSSGRTIFLTTHDMNVAEELCDRVAFLVDGEIALVNSPRALKLEYGASRVRVEYQVDGRVEARDYALDGLGDDSDFIQLLKSKEVQTMHTQEASLEEIFIEVTGRGLR